MTVVLSGELVKRLTDYLERENIKYEFEKYKRIWSAFLHIDGEGEKRICDVLSEFVINHHIKKYLNSYLDTEFYFFEKNEKQILLQKVLQRIDKDEISQKIESFFDEKGCIILDGFFKFRLKDYMAYVDALIMEEAEKMTAEKEINEFANLLRFFVSIGDSICDTVHITRDKEEFVLTDDKGASLLDIPDIMYEFSDFEHQPEDELLSSLVSIAPKHIIIHKSAFSENDDMHLIQKVFENSIELCDGKCEKCREITENFDNH